MVEADDVTAADAGAATPLAGVTVLVLRARHQAAGLVDRLEGVGASVVTAPVLQIAPGNTSRLRRVVGELASGAHQAVCFTSSNAVTALADALEAEGRDARVFAEVFVACVGPATADRLLERLGLRADLVPERSTSASLGDVFPAGPGRVLLPRGDLAGADLPAALRAKGWDVDEVLAYRTRTATRLPGEVLDGLADGSIDFVAFTSASTVRGFDRLLAGRPSHAAAVSIGPMTSEACRTAGIAVAAEAERHDLDGLVEAIVTLVRPTTEPIRPRRSGAPWPSDTSVERMLALDAARAGQPVPVRHAVGFALGIGALGGAVATLKPWQWDDDAS
ncbi:MAG: uroporphyrinogen-III synthase [Nitriliruptorales bacterium]|nr:uroporphyrinogen-III synthase [Nitriliruptorales bacterium]